MFSLVKTTAMAIAFTGAASACVTLHLSLHPVGDTRLEGTLFDGTWEDSTEDDKLCTWEVPSDATDVPYHAGACQDGWAALLTTDFNSMTATPEGADSVTFEYDGQWEREGIFPPVYVDRIRVSNC